MVAESKPGDNARGKILSILVHPLGVLWLLFALAVVGGVVEWVFFDNDPWEAWGAAGVIAGVIGVVASTRGISPWPWR